MTELIPRMNKIRQPYTVFQKTNKKADELVDLFKQKIDCDSTAQNFIRHLLVEMAYYTEEDYNKDLYAYLKDRFQNQSQAFGFGKIGEEAVKRELDSISKDVLGEPLIISSSPFLPHDMDPFCYMY